MEPSMNIHEGKGELLVRQFCFQTDESRGGVTVLMSNNSQC